MSQMMKSQPKQSSSSLVHSERLIEDRIEKKRDEGGRQEMIFSLLWKNCLTSHFQLLLVAIEIAQFEEQELRHFMGEI